MLRKNLSESLLAKLQIFLNDYAEIDVLFLDYESPQGAQDITNRTRIPRLNNHNI